MVPSNNIDELLYIRQQAYINRNYELTDQIRSYLDDQLVFTFDFKEGQEVYHLCIDHFRFKNKKEETEKMNNRKYVEYIIKRDKRAESNLDAWIFSNKSSK